MKKYTAGLIIFLLAVTILACKDTNFEKVAKGIEGVEITVNGLEKVIIEGNLRGMISVEDARAVLLACNKIMDANEQASILVRQLHKLNQQDQVNLFQVIHPVLETVDRIMAADLVSIKDPETKNKIKLAIGVMQLTLRGIEAALVEGGKNVAGAEEQDRFDFRYDGNGQCWPALCYALGYDAKA